MSSALTAVIGTIQSSRRSGTSAVQTHPGYTALTASVGRAFWDLNNSSGSDESGYAAGNAGLFDLTGGGNDLVPGGSPLINQITYGSNTIKGLKDTGAVYLDTEYTGDLWFNSSFEFFMLVRLSDGVPATENTLFSASSGNGKFRVSISQFGRIVVGYQSHSGSGGLFVWTANSGSALPDGENTFLLRVKLDFESDAISVWKDGVPVGGDQTSSVAITAQNPALWSCDENFVVGSRNNFGVITETHTEENTIVRVAITDVLTNDDAVSISEYLGSVFTVLTGSVPTTQASLVTVTPRETEADFEWVEGNGTNTLILIKEDGPVDAFPVDGQAYTVGNEIGTGNFVYYAGTGGSATVTGITGDSALHYAVFTYNASGYRYLTDLNENDNYGSFYSDYIYDGDFANYATDFTKSGSGFTDTVSSGALRLDGDPGGWLDYVSHDDWLGANLEQFEIEIRVTIIDAPDTTSYGIGLGIRNNLASEANRAIVGEFILNTNHPTDFGKVRIYAGTGASSSPSAITLSGTSSTTTLTPTAGETYTIVFRRELQNNDAFYSITVTEGSTGFIATAGYTEVSRPSSAFFGTTMRTWIHQNGGDHSVDYFEVRRVTDAAVVPSPTTYDVNVDVVNGLDTNDGSTGSPKRSVESGIARIIELGGSNRTMYLGPGTHILNSYVSVPLNCSKIDGAGKGVTFLTGASNLRGQFSGSGGANQALLNFSSASMTTHNITVSNMTLDGGSRGTQNGLANDICVRVGVYVNYRDGVVLDEMEFRDFNIFGTWHKYVQNTAVTNSEYFNCGGNSVGDYVYPSASSTSTYITGAMGLGPVNGHDITNVTVNNPNYGHGYPIKIYTAEAGVYPTLTDLVVNNLVTNQHDRSPWTYQVGITVANINTELNIAGLMDNVVFENCTFNQGFFSIMTRNQDPETSSVIIRNNIFRTNTFAWEIFCHNVQAYGNFITGNGSLVEGNGRCRGLYKLSSGFNSEDKYPGITRWGVTIRNNFIEVDGNADMVEAPTITMKNFTFRNNTVAAMSSGSGVTLQTSPPAASGAYKGPWSGLLIEDNAYTGPYNGNMFSVGGAGVSGTVRNNKATSHVVTQVISGITGGTGQQNTTNISTLGFTQTGTKPIPFYVPASGSILIGAGNGADNVGAV